MGERETNIATARKFLERAHQKLYAARILLKEGLYDEVASRAYYGAFLAARAILLLLGENPRTHGGLLAAFGARLVNEGLVDSDYGKILTRLFEARQTSDYHPFVWTDESDARQYLKDAERFVAKMKDLIDQFTQE